MTPSRRTMASLAERYGAPDPFGTTFVTVAGDACRLEISPGLPDTLWISKISLPGHLRGQGHGSRIMRDILGLASNHGCSIGLEAFWDPSWEDGGRMIRFYRRLGFEEEAVSDQGYMELVWKPHLAPHAFNFHT